MLKDIFFDITTVIAVISIGNQILINQEITPTSPFKLRLFFSTMAGLLGIILMTNGVQIMPGIILDFHNIAIILSAAYCGFAAALITGLVISVFRLFYENISLNSVVMASTVLVTSFCCGLIVYYVKRNRQRWLFMSLITLIVPTVSCVFLLGHQSFLPTVLVIYWAGSTAIAVLVYLYVKYLNLSRFLYRKYQLYSSKDHRTGLNNVRQFDNELNNVTQKLTANSVIVLQFIDIDCFKKINDTYGHQNGDKLLEDLGKILLSSCSSNDIVSRNGGDEFSVLMTDCPRDKIIEVAERIRAAVQEHKFYLIDGQFINITVSIGVAIYPDTVNDISLIVERADLALYEAKRTGRNKVMIDQAETLEGNSYPSFA